MPSKEFLIQVFLFDIVCPLYIMDSMLGENKNLKDSEQKSLMTPYGTGASDMPILLLPYTKTNKLVTALYMVTDTMEKEEPIRLKLRTLGVEILSDITMSKAVFDTQKIDQILSFLNIASDIRMISEMNSNILRKEFTELKQFIQEFTVKNNLWLEELTKDSPSPSPLLKSLSFSKGHQTRIGVQKGSTLMSALSKVGHAGNFQVLKDKRRESIIKIIKDKPDGISIKDISVAIKNLGEEMGNKTLQRELISMVKDNVLKKTGDKRWSQYSLN